MDQYRRIAKQALTLAVMCTIALSMWSTVGSAQPTTPAHRDDMRTVLFEDTDAALIAARTAHADVLAPKNFAAAMKSYRQAEVDLEQGDDLDDIRENLRKATAYFEAAVEATRLAELTFLNSLKARSDAQTTEAAVYASTLWLEAEKKFTEAARDLEDGDLNDAKKKSGEAETIYRRAELDAIKANYLDEARALLKQAEEMDVEDRAPATLRDARQLLRTAEKELNDNRYDTDVARNLAQQARDQARHAIYLSAEIKRLKEEDRTWEDLMLASETPLKNIAEKTGHESSFDTGLGKTADEIIAYVGACQDSVAALNQELIWKNQELDLQQARTAELEKKLGNQAQERSLLSDQIASQVKARETFERVERSFSREEARVLREDYDVIIRLVGLDFPSGKATIERESFGLLTKLRNAIDAFPGSTVSVHGYTDSYGGDAANLTLSEERATAVKQYILANTEMNDDQIDVVGYGESQPIASNGSAEGRATNRRVEVVVHPRPAAGL